MKKLGILVMAFIASACGDEFDPNVHSVTLENQASDAFFTLTAQVDRGEETTVFSDVSVPYGGRRVLEEAVLGGPGHSVTFRLKSTSFGEDYSFPSITLPIHDRSYYTAYYTFNFATSQYGWNVLDGDFD